MCTVRKKICKLYLIKPCKLMYSKIFSVSFNEKKENKLKSKAVFVRVIGHVIQKIYWLKVVA